MSICIARLRETMTLLMRSCLQGEGRMGYVMAVGGGVAVLCRKLNTPGLLMCWFRRIGKIPRNRLCIACCRSWGSKCQTLSKRRTGGRTKRRVSVRSFVRLSLCRLCLPGASILWGNEPLCSGVTSIFWPPCKKEHRAPGPREKMFCIFVLNILYRPTATVLL